MKEREENNMRDNIDGHLANLFKEYSAKSPTFEESFELIQEISDGKIWLIGSFIYGNLTKLYHHDSNIEKQFYRDIDFIAERAKKDMGVKSAAKGWEIYFTSYNSISFAKNGRTVDLNYLPNFLPVTMTKLQNPEIEDVLDYAPLTIQTFAYDCKEEKIIAKKSGRDSLLSKTIMVNNELGAVLGAYRKLREERKDDPEYKPSEDEIISKINSFLKIKGDELKYGYSNYAPAPGSFSKLLELMV